MMSPNKMVKFLNGCEAKETVQKCLEALKPLPQSDEIQFCENLLEILIDTVSDAEVGLIEFLRLGGLNTCQSYINGPYKSLRLKSCRLIAEVAQNNPPAQDASFKAQLLPQLMNITDSEIEMKSAMTAISAIVRGHEPALTYFIHKGGREFLIKGLEAENVEIVKKIAFFLSTAFSERQDLKDNIRAMGVVEIILKRIDKAVETNEEYLLELLLDALINIVENDNKAIEECQLPKHRLKQNLKICKEKYSDETLAGHTQTLIRSIFNGTVDTED